MKNNLKRVLGTTINCCFLSISLLCSVQVSANGLNNGSILSIDSTAGTAADGQLFVINPQSGQRSVLSDFGLSSSGPLGIDPNAVTWLPATLLGPSAGILVSDGSAGTGGRGALFKVDPLTGTRTLLSDFGNSAEGPLGDYPIGVLAQGGLIDSFPTIYVIDAFAGTNGQGAIFQVDGVNGYRSLISDFGNSNQGALGVYPDSISWKPGLLGLLGNSIVVADASAGTNLLGGVFVVNPVTGVRTLLSDFGNSVQGPVDSNPLSGPNSIVVAPAWSSQAGNIFVLDAKAGSNSKGELVKVSVTTGYRTIISDFGNSLQGPIASGFEPTGALTWQAQSTGRDGILVQDGDAGTNQSGALYSVNPTTGIRTLLSDFGNASLGSLGSLPAGLGVVP
ncbi:MAG: hypothetical protein ABI171_08835 [Collimonas sp.]|uniref:hypothetical protein n=1 Tax=Collimonas sp. TaxID=1963772 RepID=UPI003267E72E